MTPARHPGLLVLALALLASLTMLAILAREAHGQAAPADTIVPYSLTAPPSEFDWGCMGACACPVFVQAPMTGSFSLVRRGTDAATGTTTYDVLDVRWSAPRSGGAVTAMMGAGTYTRTQADPPTDHMTLDLSFDGGLAQHFDSGEHPVSVTFPEIRADLRLHEAICFDSLLVVDAKPALVACACDPPVIAGMRAFPNPFAGSMAFEITLPRLSAVTLAIYDAAGRRIRLLAQGEVLDSGFLSRSWDGRRDDGASAAPGLYLARLDAPGVRWTRPIVMLAR